MKNETIYTSQDFYYADNEDMLNQIIVNRQHHVARFNKKSPRAAIISKKIQRWQTAQKR